MEYESFLPVAKSAIEQDCIIFKEYNGKVIQSKDLSIVTKDCHDYYFHLPIAGEVIVKILSDGREVIDYGYSETGNSIIRAGFSYFNGKQITRSRLFAISGYHNDIDEWIPRPDCLTKVYNSLVRKAKGLAPYTELTDVLTHRNGECYGDKFEWKHKEYITAYCLNLRGKGYSLSIGK